MVDLHHCIYKNPQYLQVHRAPISSQFVFRIWMVLCTSRLSVSKFIFSYYTLIRAPGQTYWLLLFPDHNVLIRSGARFIQPSVFDRPYQLSIF